MNRWKCGLELCSWLLAGSAALAAQGRVWIVDASNGPGTSFLDLPPAEAAAADGDVLVVRPGDYSFLATSKGITVLGTTGAAISLGSIFGVALQVTNLPAGKSFVLRRMALAPANRFITGMILSSCAGSVEIEDVLDRGATCEIRGCADVAITRLTSQAYYHMVLVDSSVLTLIDTSWSGLGASRGFLGTVSVGFPALVCMLSELWLVNTLAQGGDGLQALSGPSAAPKPGILASACVLHLLAGTAIGAGGGTYLVPTPAIDAGASTLEVDPTVQLTPFYGAAAVVGAASVTTRPLAVLTCPAASLGGTLAPTLRSPAGDPYLLALGRPSAPVATPIGKLFVDLTLWTPMAAGSQAATGQSTFPLAIPNDPSLRGRTLALQAANGYSGLGLIGLTNAVRVTLD